jgi:predicted transcriptional regulator
MKNVYRLTEMGWVLFRRCQSFHDACKVARELNETTGFEHCVNS